VHATNVACLELNGGHLVVRPGGVSNLRGGGAFE
jgi:hypothetical protein